MKKITFIIIIFSIVSIIPAVHASTPAEERKIMQEKQYKRHSLRYARAFIGDLAPTYCPDKEQELLTAHAELGDIRNYITSKAFAYGPSRADQDKDVQILWDRCAQTKRGFARERYFDADYFYRFVLIIINNKINNIDKHLWALCEKKLKE